MTTRITTDNIADGTIETIDIKTSGLGSGAIEAVSYTHLTLPTRTRV